MRRCLAGPDPSVAEIEGLPYECVVCGTKEHLELDHIIPLAKKGRNAISNRQWLCRTHNRQKNTKIGLDNRTFWG